MLELPDRHRDRVIELVLSDGKRNSWNRHHDGDLGATVGYAVLVLENDDRVRENDGIDAIELVKELCDGDDVDVDDVADFARRRADERGLNL